MIGEHRVVAIEEHYYDAELAALYTGVDARTGGWVRDRLEDVGADRVAAMDAAGIDVQVLSHGAPSTQRLDAATGVPMARRVNDRLRSLCDAFPGRFAGFAALPTADPDAAADELSRAVGELGFKGAMIHGLVGEERAFIDDRRFWPIFARAEALGVPLYIHPANPHPAVVDAYLKDYVEAFPGIVNAAWGFTMETATIGIRIVLSGVLDAHPGVQVILGHLGETLPFLAWRIDMALQRPGNAAFPFKETFTRHFHVTTSGFFSDPALLCCLQEMGADRILFAVDYPFVPMDPGPVWMDRLMLNAPDKAKILHGNAARLLGV